MGFSNKMKLQIEDNLQIVHTAQLVYLNHQDLSLTHSPDDVILAGSEISKTNEDHKNIKIFAVPILCDAYVQLNYAVMYI